MLGASSSIFTRHEYCCCSIIYAILVICRTFIFWYFLIVQNKFAINPVLIDDREMVRPFLCHQIVLENSLLHKLIRKSDSVGVSERFFPDPTIWNIANTAYFPSLARLYEISLYFQKISLSIFRQREKDLHQTWF